MFKYLSLCSILFALSCTSKEPSEKGATSPVSIEAEATKPDSTVTYELKANNGNKHYIIRVMDHNGNGNSLNVYKQLSGDSMQSLFYMYGEYTQPAGFFVMTRDKVYDTNFCFTPQGDLLFCYTGQGRYCDLLMISENKPFKIYESRKGCFLYDKPNHLLVWDNGGRLGDVETPMADHSQITYYSCTPGGKIRSRTLFDTSPEYKNDLLFCFSEDRSLNALKSMEESILKILKKGKTE